jgi:hypothetical protein
MRLGAACRAPTRYASLGFAHFYASVFLVGACTLTVASSCGNRSEKRRGIGEKSGGARQEKNPNAEEPQERGPGRVHSSERERHEGILHKIQKKTDSADRLGVQLPGFWNYGCLFASGEERARLAAGVRPELNQEYSFGAHLAVVLNSNLNILKYL